jgi:PAS domain-containing protein
MSGMEGHSLLNFLDAPVLVGDPEGRVIFVNPAFRREFCRTNNSPQGESLANIFSGGGRESMLAAVASVCGKGESVKFRLREDGRGYLVVASPIEADQNQVGVMVLLTDEPMMDGRLLDFHREIQEPLEETLECFEDLVDQSGGRSERHISTLERGMASLGRARKWSDELQALLCGAPNEETLQSSFSPNEVVRSATARVANELERAKVELKFLVSLKLAEARGDAMLLETVLVRLIRQRLSDATSGGRLTLLAREAGIGSARCLLVSLVDHIDTAGGGPVSPDSLVDSEPRMVRETVSVLGGRIVSVVLPSVGYVTSIRLGFADQSIASES